MYALITPDYGLLVMALLLRPFSPAPTPARAESVDVELHRSCSDLVEPGVRPYRELAPDYSIQRRSFSAGKPRFLILQISVPTEAIWEAPMVGLGCRLASDFANEAGVDALIFDDKRSAGHLALGFTDQTNYGWYLWHLRARYELDRKRGREYVEFLLPDVEDRLLNLKRYRIWITGN